MEGCRENQHFFFPLTCGIKIAMKALKSNLAKELQADLKGRVELTRFLTADDSSKGQSKPVVIELKRRDGITIRVTPVTVPKATSSK